MDTDLALPVAFRLLFENTSILCLGKILDIKFIFQIYFLGKYSKIEAK